MNELDKDHSVHRDQKQKLKLCHLTKQAVDLGKELSKKPDTTKMDVATKMYDLINQYNGCLLYCEK